MEVTSKETPILVLKQIVFIHSENLYTLELYPCLARFIFIFFTQKDIRLLEEGRK